MVQLEEHAHGVLPVVGKSYNSWGDDRAYHSSETKDIDLNSIELVRSNLSFGPVMIFL